MANYAQLRGVSVRRLSVLTDETTSPQRQQEANQRVAAELGIDLAGREAEDLDVSASKTNPFQRPKLGEWLRRPMEFDALVWWRFDRAIRSMADMHELAKWAREYRKMLVFAEGIGGGRLVFDFRNPMDPVSELMMMMFAFAAQVEAMSIRDRVTGAHAAMRNMRFRYAGGPIPYGYMTVNLDGGGRTLIPDSDPVADPADPAKDLGPAPVAVIERIIRELLGGKSLAGIAEGLNSEGILTPRDYWSKRMKRQTGGKVGGKTHDRYTWNPGSIRRLLLSPVLIGWKTYDGAPVRDSEGRPIPLTVEPILTRQEFDAIGQMLEQRGNRNVTRKDTDALLLGSARCPSCRGPLYLTKRSEQQDGRGEGYGCNAKSRGKACEAPVSVKRSWIEEYAETTFRRRLGPVRVRYTETIPGYDPRPEIEATAAEYEAHQEQQGRQASSAAKAAWQRRADALDKRLAELEAMPVIEPQTIVTESDRTFEDEWDEGDTATRRGLLQEAGVQIFVQRGVKGARKADESRFDFVITEPFYADAAYEIEALRESLENE
ncbi:recombinase family protein [Streptomyces nigrescens]|uniref:recombinase family protein n=1 Tax=Streptomyces nigrescens TaxID=1920 RepID=UPI00381A035A